MSKYKPKDGCRNVWLKVTPDRYEFPVALADTAAELAQICGVTEGSILSSVSKAKHGIRKSLYRKVRIERDGEA
ncbi:MAG: hypothetical protein VZQ95_09430 [Erysipelotrichaceae bacterium]|nr:hypothetical protein [Erysipelotrichaceae bacterium]